MNKLFHPGTKLIPLNTTIDCLGLLHYHNRKDTCRGKWLTGKERALHSKPPVCLNLKLITYIQLRSYRHNTLLGRGHNSKKCYNYSPCQWFTLHRSKHKVVWSEIPKILMFAWVKIKYLELQNEFCSRTLNWYLELWNLGMNNMAMEKE